ncbi:MAG: 5'-nucleotidase C-terminal domain-containing protein [Clostridia bacterium]|nr:5'-nucleotidase C-terminal domain-containing protein [Clostridia bacterium]
MRNSKWIALLLALVMVLSSFGFAFADESAETAETAAASDDIVILHINDAHCHNYADYAKLVTLAKDADLVVDNGDAIQGDVIGTLSKGEYITEIMNYVGIDVAGLGNHEFDYGMDQIKKIVGELAEFPYVCCNLVDLRTGEPLFDAYKIFEVKGKKIAIVGVDTPETFVKSTPTYFQDEEGNYIYSFSEGNDGQNLYDAVQKAVDAARAEGADYVIVNGHLGVEAESAPYRSTDVVANTKGVDIFIDGHSHTVYSEMVKDLDGKDVLIQQTGSYLENIGKLTIAADGTIKGENVATEGVEADADTAAFIATITERFEALQNEVVAKTEVNLTTKNEDGSRAVRTKETNLGDLCADAYLNVMDADIAFVNGGGIRADLPAGDITYGDVVSVHPFGNMACLVEVTGQQVLDALELGYSQLPGEMGGFLQVAGLTCTVNTAVKSPVVRNDKGEFESVDGQRRVSDVMVNGEPIDPAATYKLASHNYMLKSCGDGYTMFGTDNVTLLRDEVLIDNQVLINYIVDDLGGVVGEAYAEPQGRINIVDDKSAVDVASYFSDVNEGDWFVDHVQAAFASDIIAGFHDGTYRPDGNLTHAQIMVMAANLHSEQKKDEYDFQANRKDGDAWYQVFEDYCVAEGIVSAETFGAGGPFEGKENENVTRAQMAFYFANTLADESYTDKKEVALSDISGHIFAPEIEKLAKADIVGGFPDGTYRPEELVTRAQAAVFVHNILNAIAE